MALGRRDDVAVKFGGDDSRFQKVAKRVRRTTSDLNSSFSKAGASLGAMFTGKLVGGLGVIASAFSLAGKSALEFADSIAKTADKIGVGVEELQQLRYAASTAGVAQQQLDTALQRFSRRTAEAAQGTGVLHKEFERLGIEVRNEDGTMRSVTEVMDDYADAVRRTRDPQEQLRLSVAAFDTEGAGMVNLLRQGSSGMKELTAAAKELGLVLDENTVRSSEELNQAWDNFTTRISVQFKSAVLDAAKFIDNLSGNYRTTEDIEKRIVKNKERIVWLEKAANKAGEFRADQYRERVRLIEKENEQLELKLKLLNQEKSLREQDRGLTPGGGPSNRPKPDTKPGLPGLPGGGKDAAGGEPISHAEAAALRADALRRFRNGEITQHQLGAEDAVVDFHRGLIDESEARARQVLPEDGAYGTPGNLSKPLPEAPTALRENYWGDPDDSMDTRTGGAVWEAGVAPNTHELDRQIEQFLANRKYIVWVEPRMVGLDGIENVALDNVDKVGGRE